MLLVGLWLGCVPLPEASEAPPPLSPRDLWLGLYRGGEVAHVEAVITSPRPLSDDHFYVQAPGGGPQSGLRVELLGVLAAWPPPVGTPVALTGPVYLDSLGPRMQLRREADLVVLGEPSPPVAVPWADDPNLNYALVTLEDLQITSRVDPVGRADTSAAPKLGGLFGVAPGYLSEGSLTGIRFAGVNPRTEADWTGDFDDAETPQISLVEVADQPEGAWVLFEASVATPASVDGRQRVLQDEAGHGLWLDVEGFGVQSARGELGLWQGEVRRSGEGLHLRTWVAPEVIGTREAVATPGGRADGDLTQVQLSGLGAADALGERPFSEGLLDDRFTDLSPLVEGEQVWTAVRWRGAALRFAALP